MSLFQRKRLLPLAGDTRLLRDEVFTRNSHSNEPEYRHPKEWFFKNSPAVAGIRYSCRERGPWYTYRGTGCIFFFFFFPRIPCFFSLDRRPSASPPLSPTARPQNWTSPSPISLRRSLSIPVYQVLVGFSFFANHANLPFIATREYQEYENRHGDSSVPFRFRSEAVFFFKQSFDRRLIWR